MQFKSYISQQAQVEFFAKGKGGSSRNSRSNLPLYTDESKHKPNSPPPQSKPTKRPAGVKQTSQQQRPRENTPAVELKTDRVRLMARKKTPKTKAVPYTAKALTDCTNSVF